MNAYLIQSPKYIYTTPIIDELYYADTQNYPKKT